MIALLFAVFLGVPPYPAPPTVSPPVLKSETACKCGDSCPCKSKAATPKGTGTPVTFTDGTPGLRHADGSYSVLQNVGASAQTPTNGGGCYINANGQKVCPLKR